MRLRVAVLGASGRVGRLLVAAILADESLVLVGAVVGLYSDALGRDAGVLAGQPPCEVPVVAPSVAAFADAQVVVDFSSPAALMQSLPLLGGAALVSGTTGLGPAELEALDARAMVAPVLHAANFSRGVSVLRALVEAAARALPGAEVEIIEAHHRAKRDAPSGTALALGASVEAGRGAALHAVHGREGLSGPREAESLGYHAVRGGSIVGEHQVWLILDGERLELSHVCSDRGAFALGALQAAIWLVGREPGRYDFEDVLGLRTER